MSMLSIFAADVVPSVLLAFVPLLIILFIVLVLLFELWMVIAVIEDTTMKDSEKVVWIISMFVLHPFVALYYYFTRYRNRHHVA